MHFSILSDLKKTTVVVESLSTTSTRCSVPEITSLLQDSTNRMRNLHQIMWFLVVTWTFTCVFIQVIICICTTLTNWMGPTHYMVITGGMKILVHEKCWPNDHTLCLGGYMINIKQGDKGWFYDDYYTWFRRVYCKKDPIAKAWVNI